MYRREPLPLTRGRDSFTTGWKQPVEQRARQLRAEQAALEARLATIEDNGEPVSYKGVKVFEPQSSSFAVDYLQDGASSALANVVVPDAQTFDIPMRVTGPGTFQARFLQVSVYKRLWAPLNMAAAISASNPANENWLNYSSNVLWNTGLSARAEWTTKFCLFPRQPVGNIPNWNALNFFWNIFDGRNNDYLADQLISHQFLRPRTSQDAISVPAADGGLFEFDCPWGFERDANIIFQFRPITPILQFDSSVAGTDAAMGMAYDDRENGRRVQSVKVEVELFGDMYITDQDVASSGVRSTRRGVKPVR